MSSFNTIPPSAAYSYVRVKFNGDAGKADELIVKFNVSMPPNLNIDASETLSLDAEYACSYSGGGSQNNSTTTGITPGALVFPVTILSALRTYFAGTALDFGEIGLVTDDYANKNTGDQNYVYVQSSGAYDITLQSEKGFVMVNTNGVTDDKDKIKYSLEFLGENLSSEDYPTPNQIALTKNCKRAGLSTVARQLPIKATLMEAGAGKNPSSLYLDTLTVTLAPKAYNEIGVEQCGFASAP